ncbi:MAG: hypothetical protein NZM29_04655 [Nitrospira sp.]|nr:hypothetical protein [Nitrospira sp.]
MLAEMNGDKRNSNKRSEGKSMTRGQRIELLEVIQYVLAIVLIVGAVSWTKYLVPPLVISVAAIPYAVWRKIQNIERGQGLFPDTHQIVPIKQSPYHAYQWRGLRPPISGEEATNGKLSPERVPVVAILERERASQGS